jgi:hypothetical protein
MVTLFDVLRPNGNVRLRVVFFLRFGLQLHLLILPVVNEVRLICILRSTSLIFIVIVHWDFGIFFGVIFGGTPLSALLLPLRLSLTFGDPI